MTRNSSIAELTPMKRMGRADELGWPIAFLCTPQAGYVNGINLPVDGGRTRSL